MHERHEEYMKRRMREEEIPAKFPQRKKIFESPDGGKTVYERDFGSTKRTKIKSATLSIDDLKITLEGANMPNYKYNEDSLIKEFKAYIDATYDQHYSRDKFQATEFIMDGGHGTGFCIGNVLKYAQRYGKKGTHEDARKDLMKVLHYTLLQLYVHDNDL